MAASFYTRHRRPAGPEPVLSTPRGQPCASILSPRIRLLRPSSISQGTDLKPSRLPPTVERPEVCPARRNLPRTPFAKAADTCGQPAPDCADGSTRDLKPRPPHSLAISQRTGWQPVSTLGYPKSYFPESTAHKNRRRGAEYTPAVSSLPGVRCPVRPEQSPPIKAARGVPIELAY